MHEAAHSCAKILCINKRHLRWASRSENEFDKLVQGRPHGPRMEAHGHARLAQVQVLAIRESTAPQPIIAAKFGISQQSVSDIKLRKTWAKT